MPEISPSKYTVMAGWDDVPHLDETTKKELLASTPPHLRDARSKGIPSLGSGAIYPFQFEQISIEPFIIPEHWKRAYAMDVGWNRTAVIWGAIDPTDDVAYLYSEHYMGEERPLVHAAAIKSRGDWIRGVIDPAADGRAQQDGKRLLDAYRAQGLDLTKAENAVEAGLHKMYEALATGKLKVFSTLVNFANEFRIYRRDENGKVVKENDHLMDCGRYWVASARKVARTRPISQSSQSTHQPADRIAGY